MLALAETLAKNMVVLNDEVFDDTWTCVISFTMVSHVFIDARSNLGTRSYTIGSVCVKLL